jgi:hypothetical protein
MSYKDRLAQAQAARQNPGVTASAPSPVPKKQQGTQEAPAPEQAPASMAYAERAVPSQNPEVANDPIFGDGIMGASQASSVPAAMRGGGEDITEKINDVMTLLTKNVGQPLQGQEVSKALIRDHCIKRTSTVETFNKKSQRLICGMTTKNGTRCITKEAGRSPPLSGTASLSTSSRLLPFLFLDKLHSDIDLALQRWLPERMSFAFFVLPTLLLTGSSMWCSSLICWLSSRQKTRGNCCTRCAK